MRFFPKKYDIIIVGNYTATLLMCHKEIPCGINFLSGGNCIMKLNKIYNTDCIAGMSGIEDESIDMILCDLPYGITNCKWDTIIPFNMLWEQYERIIKPRGAIVLTACQPFTTSLINSNRKMFRYCWYWIKNQVTGFPFSKYQPLRCVEDICVFYKKSPTYNPQGLIETSRKRARKNISNDFVYSNSLSGEYVVQYTNYPRQTLNIKCQHDGIHPTQKPVKLFEYLVRTYTDEGEVVLDNCMGSGTTAIACLKAKRQFIGFEIDKKYFDIACKRIENFKEGNRNAKGL